MNNKLKIISGKYKSRFIQIPDKKNLRPSKAYIRESLFNVLDIHLCNSSLDLFSGSGILSFEAISRGIKKSVLIEND
ncbi:MAG: RsmD family RNA methyltransferase, partial [Gammaproteobacteria bacterium]